MVAMMNNAADFERGIRWINRNIGPIERASNDWNTANGDDTSFVDFTDYLSPLRLGTALNSPADNDSAFKWI